MSQATPLKPTPPGVGRSRAAPVVAAVVLAIAMFAVAISSAYWYSDTLAVNGKLKLRLQEAQVSVAQQEAHLADLQKQHHLLDDQFTKANDQLDQARSQIALAQTQAISDTLQIASLKRENQELQKQTAAMEAHLADLQKQHHLLDDQFTKANDQLDQARSQIALAQTQAISDTLQIASLKRENQELQKQTAAMEDARRRFTLAGRGYSGPLVLGAHTLGMLLDAENLLAIWRLSPKSERSSGVHKLALSSIDHSRMLIGVSSKVLNSEDVRGESQERYLVFQSKARELSTALRELANAESADAAPIEKHDIEASTTMILATFACSSELYADHLDDLAGWLQGISGTRQISDEVINTIDKHAPMMSHMGEEAWKMVDFERDLDSTSSRMAVEAARRSREAMQAYHAYRASVIPPRSSRLEPGATSTPVPD